MRGRGQTSSRRGHCRRGARRECGQHSQLLHKHDGNACGINRRFVADGRVRPLNVFCCCRPFFSRSQGISQTQKMISRLRRTLHHSHHRCTASYKDDRGRTLVPGMVPQNTAIPLRPGCDLIRPLLPFPSSPVIIRFWVSYQYQPNQSFCFIPVHGCFFVFLLRLSRMVPTLGSYAGSPPRFIFL